MQDELVRDKHSSLLRNFVNYGQKRFVTLPRVQFYKTLYGRNLPMFVISCSVCPLQAITPWSNVYIKAGTNIMNFRNKLDCEDGHACAQCYKTTLVRNLMSFVLS